MQIQIQIRIIGLCMAGACKAHLACVTLYIGFGYTHQILYQAEAWLRVYLGSPDTDILLSAGATPTEVNVCKKKMPGVRKVKVRNSGRAFS